jgi:hypothetical protein
MRSCGRWTGPAPVTRTPRTGEVETFVATPPEYSLEPSGDGPGGMGSATTNLHKGGSRSSPHG